MKLALLATILGLALQAPTELRRIDDYAGHAADLSASAGLPSLAPTSNTPEVRVWSSAALVDSTVGWVITPHTITTYSSRGSSRVASTVSTPRAIEVLNGFLKLRTYSGQSASCRVRDGWSLIVEGTDSSGHYAFFSGNPNRCNDQGASDVWRAYSLLLEVARDAP